MRKVIVLNDKEFPFRSEEFWKRLIDNLRARGYQTSEHAILDFLVPKVLELNKKHFSSSSSCCSEVARGTNEVCELFFDKTGFCVDITLAALEFDFSKIYVRTQHEEGSCNTLQQRSQ